MKLLWSVTKEGLRKYNPPAIHWLVYGIAFSVMTIPDVLVVIKWVLVFMLPITYFGSAMEALRKEYTTKIDAADVAINSPEEK